MSWNGTKIYTIKKSIFIDFLFQGSFYNPRKLLHELQLIIFNVKFPIKKYLNQLVYDKLYFTKCYSRLYSIIDTLLYVIELIISKFPDNCRLLYLQRKKNFYKK